MFQHCNRKDLTLNHTLWKKTKKYKQYERLLIKKVIKLKSERLGAKDELYSTSSLVTAKMYLLNGKEKEIVSLSVLGDRLTINYTIWQHKQAINKILDLFAYQTVSGILKGFFVRGWQLLLLCFAFQHWLLVCAWNISSKARCEPLQHDNRTKLIQFTSQGWGLNPQQGRCHGWPSRLQHKRLTICKRDIKDFIKN